MAFSFARMDEAGLSAVNSAASLMGYIELKEKQTEAIYGILSRKDTFVALPTGYGKSIIYGILPLAFDQLLNK